MTPPQPPDSRPAADSPARSTASASSPPSSWHLITGEYPPGGGGVGEYTRLLARALAAERVDVHVWAPAEAESGGGVTVHPVDGFGRAGRREMDRGLDAVPGPRRLLVPAGPAAPHGSAVDR